MKASGLMHMQDGGHGHPPADTHGHPPAESVFAMGDMQAAGFPIRYASPGFEQLYGLRAAEVLGKKCGSLVGGPCILAGVERLAVAATAAGCSIPEVQRRLQFLTGKASEACRVMLREPGKQAGVALLVNRKKNGTLFTCECLFLALKHPSINWSYCVGFQKDVSKDVPVQALLAAAGSEEGYARLLLARGAALDGRRAALVGEGSENMVRSLHEKALDVFSMDIWRALRSELMTTAKETASGPEPRPVPASTPPPAPASASSGRPSATGSQWYSYPGGSFSGTSSHPRVFPKVLAGPMGGSLGSYSPTAAPSRSPGAARTTTGAGGSIGGHAAPPFGRAVRPVTRPGAPPAAAVGSSTRASGQAPGPGGGQGVGPGHLAAIQPAPPPPPPAPAAAAPQGATELAPALRAAAGTVAAAPAPQGWPGAPPSWRCLAPGEGQGEEPLLPQQLFEANPVVQFLTGVGLRDYAPTLLVSGFDELRTLFDIDDADMRDLGMPRGHALKLKRCLSEHRGSLHLSAMAGRASRQPPPHRRAHAARGGASGASSSSGGVTLVERSWEQIQDFGVERCGILVFQEFFRRCPDAEQLFPPEVRDKHWDWSAEAAPNFYDGAPVLPKLWGKVVNAIGGAVTGLHDAQGFVPVLVQLGARHAHYGVKHEHFKILGKALITTLRDILGEDFSPEVELAWSVVFGFVTASMTGGLCARLAIAEGAGERVDYLAVQAGTATSGEEKARSTPPPVPTPALQPQLQAAPHRDERGMVEAQIDAELCKKADG